MFGETIKYLGTSETYQGYHVGPANATINGVSFPIICVEFDEYVSVNQIWEATLVPVIDNTLDARAAWLAEQMTPGNSGDLHFAIWNLFTSAAPDTTASNQFLIASIGKNPTGDWYRISNRGVQDFIVQMPEPTSYAMLGCGLLFLGYIRRRS